MMKKSALTLVLISLLTFVPLVLTGRDATAGPPAGTLIVVDPSPVNWLSITWNTMEELVSVDKKSKLVPGLATRWTWIDDTTLQFTLREGITFQNGEPFDARIVKKNWDEVQRWKQPHGPGPWMNFASASTIQIQDAHTVRFRFPEPDSVAFLKFRVLHIGNRQFWDELGFGYKMVGSGEKHW
jgi:ABC-type transport system substrate-binding protein